MSGSGNFQDALARAGAVALWQKPPYPPRAEAPRHWKWTEIAPLLEQSIAETDVQSAERRVLTLVAPEFGTTAAGDRVTSVTNLSANFQILMPGEVAPAHRHSMAALRFVIQGEGATTTVDGQVCQMAPGDMVLTPAWRWHEHACAGDGDKPVIWFDLLDAPLIKQLDVVEFERPDGTLSATDAAETLRFPWNEARAALLAAVPGEDGVRRHHYTRPSGLPALDLVDCHLWHLSGDQAVQIPAANSNSVCLVIEGPGESRVGDQTFLWETRDVFSVPHGNLATYRALEGDAILFVGSDREVLRRLGHNAE
jgi:gentisate 1,2-dioxygenase